MRRLAAVTLIAAMIAAAMPIAPAQAASGTVLLRLGSRQALVDGRAVTLAAAPTSVAGTTYVPLRALADLFGRPVAWDAAAREVRIGGTPEVVLPVGAREARVDGRPVPLPAPPRIARGTVLVPLRFVAEALLLSVAFDARSRTITIQPRQRPPVAVIRLPRTEVVLGEPVPYVSASYSPDGVPIVEERWENPPPWPAPGRYTLSLRVRDARGLWSAPATATVVVLPPPNRPPVARFQVSKAVVAQGERLTFADDSFDPDGDAIVERVWDGREEVFFSPGPRTITLRVRDSRGAWSEPYSVTVLVTEEQRMDELTYYLREGLPGEHFRVTGRNLREVPAVSVLERQVGGPTLLLSNSPEEVTRPGLLYRDRVSGPARVFYWHANASGGPLRIVVVARNPGPAPASVRVVREGLAGPERDAFGVGRAAMMRYLTSGPGPTLALAPGEAAVLNAHQHRAPAPGELVHGILDLEVAGEVWVSVVALPGDAAGIPDDAALPPLPADGVHPRGTFPGADVVLRLAAPSDGPASLVLPTGEPWAGVDALTGQPAHLQGSFGILYRLVVAPGRSTAVLINPRGGGKAGAIRVDGVVVPVPRNGVVLSSDQVVKGGVLPPGRDATIEFMPAGGSYLPVNVLLWPVP